jgi:hypothetical protein
VIVLILAQAGMLFCKSDMAQARIRKFFSGPAGAVTYREFYSTALFDEIKRYIPLPVEKYRVVSIGLHPAIAYYNGFRTLDMYASDYPLATKHAFRRIIAPELAKNDKMRKYFDTFGCRCYVFADELNGNAYFLKSSDQKIRNLKLDTRVLKEMGGEYVFSAVEILNAKENGLLFERVFERDDSPIRIYLYKVDPRSESGSRKE